VVAGGDSYVAVQHSAWMSNAGVVAAALRSSAHTPRSGGDGEGRADVRAACVARRAWDPRSHLAPTLATATQWMRDQQTLVKASRGSLFAATLNRVNGEPRQGRGCRSGLAVNRT